MVKWRNLCHLCHRKDSQTMFVSHYFVNLIQIQLYLQVTIALKRIISLRSFSVFPTLETQVSSFCNVAWRKLNVVSIQMLNLECFTIQIKCHFTVILNTKFLITLWNHVIYKIKCPYCNDYYIGKTERCLLTRIIQHGTKERQLMFKHLSGCEMFKDCCLFLFVTIQWRWTWRYLFDTTYF